MDSVTALTQFAFRTQKSIGLVDGFPKYVSQPGFIKPEGNNRCCTYSPDGKWFAWACPEDVKIADPNTGEVISTLPAQSVHELGFSPQGSYIITWERPTKQEDGNATKNLKVWRTETAEHVVAFVQKSQTGWNLQYTSDEKYCARVVTNEVQFFEASKMDTVWGHLRVEGVTEFALSPGKNHHIAVFVPERKGNPAMVRIYQTPNFESILSQKSFYKADRVQLKWNDLGTSVLVFTQTDADKTGKSYYGETNLYLITTAGNYDCRVQLDKDGPIHDVTWSSNSKEFGVVYGFMPAKTTLFDARANVIHQLPPGPRNTILFSPHARFVLVAGFGNLQGSTDIYDRLDRMKKICTIDASNTSVCEWSPDGQHILTATTSPRLRVDNGVKVWHYTGSLMYTSELDELYHVCWRPQSTSVYPLSNPLPQAPTPHESVLSHHSITTPKKPMGAYRPPHARNSETPLHFKREDEGGAAHVYSNGGPNINGFGKGPRRREVPGATPAEKLVPGAAPGGGVSLAGTGAGADEEQLSKSALKNKKKREAAKKAKEQQQQQQQQQQQAGGDAPGNGNVNGNNGNNGNGNGNFQGGERNARQDRDRHPHQQRSKSRNDQPLQDSHRRSKSRGIDPNQPPFQPHHSQQHYHQQNISTPLASPHKQQRPPPAPPAAAVKEPEPATPPPATAAPLSPPPQITPTAEDKKLRGLYKKLRAIEELKMRLAGGEKLEDTQMKKIGTEDQVRRELTAFEASGGGGGGGGGI